MSCNKYIGTSKKINLVIPASVPSAPHAFKPPYTNNNTYGSIINVGNITEQPLTWKENNPAKPIPSYVNGKTIK